jgi:simple sugar transport system permease protein
MISARMMSLLLGLAAALLALLAAFAITSVVLIAAGDPVGEVWGQLLSWPEQRNLANIINNATVLYLSGLAVAVGFRMNLFNIGVDGQYRVAAFTAAVVAGEAWLPGYLNTALAIICAMAVGALWAGIAGVLRATRGVSEVISTIMLNFIATGLVAYLLRQVSVREEGSNDIGTREIP